MAKPLITVEELQRLGYGANLCRRWTQIIDRAQRDRRILIDLHEVFIELCGEVGAGFGGPSIIAQILENYDWELVRMMTGRQPDEHDFSPLPSLTEIQMSDALHDMFCTGALREMQKISAEVLNSVHILLALMNSSDQGFLEFLQKAGVEPFNIVRRAYRLVLRDQYCDIVPPREVVVPIAPENMPWASVAGCVQQALKDTGMDALPVREIIIRFR